MASVASRGAKGHAEPGGDGHASGPDRNPSATGRPALSLAVGARLGECWGRVARLSLGSQVASYVAAGANDCSL